MGNITDDLMRNPDNGEPCLLVVQSGCHWCHHRPRERHRLHRLRLLQRHVRQPNLNGVGGNQR